VGIGGQSFKGMENSSGKFDGGSMAFKILSAHSARVQIHTDSIDSKLKNYLSAVSTKLECKIRIVGILHLLNLFVEAAEK